jgi:outer membrane protein
MLVRQLYRLLPFMYFAVSLATGQGVKAPSRSSPILTFDDALYLAAAQNTAIRTSALDVSKAKEQTNQARTQEFPVFKVYAHVGASLAPINLTVPRGTLGTYPSTGPIPSQDATIKTPQRATGLIYGSAAQPLSQLYKVALALRETRIGELMAQEKLRQQKQATAQQVKQAYYQLTQIQSQISSADVSLKYLEELSSYTERNLAQETVLKSDVLGVRARLSQQQYQLLTLHDNLDTQKEALNRSLGRDLRTDFSVEAEPLPSEDETSLSAAQNKAIEQRPELRQARLQTRKTELDIRRERAEYLPDLSLQISYLSFPNVSFFPQNVVSAGFVLEWQPFDWGFKKHKIAELRSTSKQAALTEHDAEQQVLLDVNASFRKLADTRVLLKVQAAAQDVEREKLRVLMNRYKEKSALLTDVLQQQSSLAQADAQYQQALAGFWTAKAAFDRALGEQR